MSRLKIAAAAAAGIAILAAASPADAQVKVDPLTGQVIAVEEPAVEEQATETASTADLSEPSDLVRQGKFDRAERRLAELRDQHPDDPALLVMLGEVRIALGRVAEAREPLERAIELAPETPRANFQLATTLLEAGEPDAAIAAFGREIEISEDPQILELARKNRVVLFQRAQAHDDAARELTLLAELVPEQQEVWGELATVSLQAGDVEAARAALEQGAEAGFQSAQHWYSVGARLFRAGKHEEALASFEQALDIDPKFARAERSLGATLEKLGRGDEAIAHLRKYLELQPDARDADKIRKQIDAAGG